MQGSAAVGEVSSACSSVASTSKTVWLLPQASAGSLRGSSKAAFLQTKLHTAASLTMEAAQHGVRDVERVHDGAPHKATPPSRLGRGIAGALSVTLVVGIVLVAVVATGARKTTTKAGPARAMPSRRGSSRGPWAARRAPTTPALAPRASPRCPTRRTALMIFLRGPRTAQTSRIARSRWSGPAPAVSTPRGGWSRRGRTPRPTFACSRRRSASGAGRTASATARSTWRWTRAPTAPGPSTRPCAATIVEKPGPSVATTRPRTRAKSLFWWTKRATTPASRRTSRSSRPNSSPRAPRWTRRVASVAPRDPGLALTFASARSDGGEDDFIIPQRLLLVMRVVGLGLDARLRRGARGADRGRHEALPLLRRRGGGGA